MIAWAVFPARAGVIPTKPTEMNWETSLSRTSGGDPDVWSEHVNEVKSFPHERG